MTFVYLIQGIRFPARRYVGITKDVDCFRRSSVNVTRSAMAIAQVVNALRASNRSR